MMFFVIIRFVFSLCLLLLLPAPRALAQLPGLPDLTGGAWKALVREGMAAKRGSAQVTLNNRELFRVYASDRARAQERAELVGLRLDEVLQGLPLRPLPNVSVRTVDGSSVLFLDDRALLTVTDADAAAYGDPTPQIASGWATTIKTALGDALRERRPEYLREAAARAGTIVLVGLLLQLALWFLATRLLERPGWPVLVLVWGGVAYLITDLFPQTRPLHNLLSEGVLRPLVVFLAVCLAAAALSRLLAAVLRRLFPAVPDTLSPEERTERTFRRRATLGGVVRVTGVTVIWLIALVVALSWSGVNLPALLASAGLIGVALGLAAQDTMKDTVAGINILIDDRFGVGDVIRVGEYEGKVENLNLRITQIRDMSGRLITFPNRNIEAVANLTSRWAQVDFKVGVGYEADLREAMRVMEAAARELADESPERVLDAPEMLGADSYNDSDITLRMVLRVAPGDQWAVARELRVRVKEAFDAAGIAIPFPQRTITIADTLEEKILSQVAGGDGKNGSHQQESRQTAPQEARR